MDNERWQQIKEILEAVETVPAQEVAAFLQSACGGDTELLRELESLLEFEELADDFIEEPLWRLATEDLEEPHPEREPAEDENLGRRIGPYRLERLLATGGMGRVYAARREDDYEQLVAIKLIRPGLQIGSDVVGRFFTERQILAQLQHPNISQLLDGGTTDDGLPYLVLEYVDGIPIDTYCHQRSLGVRERLKLFLDVCAAVHFAHQNLIVHRDLKPGNILVMEDGTPKLLDFGIAKLLEPQGGHGSHQTVLGRGPMTPNYASPEQVREEPITTASDVYSLGVLLYRLLSGRLPYELGDATYTDLVEVICNAEPRRPSTMVRQAVQQEPQEDAGSFLPPPVPTQRLHRYLTGDLDAIVLKAMRKEPQHRYNSAEQLADDIRRHLNGLPVLARQGTWTYHAGKFIRRHRMPLAACAAVLLLILSFTFVLKAQLEETRLERKTADEVVEFLVQDVFGEADPNRSKGAEVTARELLDQGRESIQNRLQDEPAVRARLLMTLGRIYNTLELREEALSLLQDACNLYRDLYKGDNRELATCINSLATTLYDSRQYEEAGNLFREALDMRRRLYGEVDGDVARTLSSLGATLEKQGKMREAEASLREALEIRRQIYGPDHIETVKSLNNLGANLVTQGRYQEAEPLLQESLEIRRTNYGEEHLDVAKAYNNLGRVRYELGKLEQADEAYQRALAIRIQLLGENSPSVASVQHKRARVLAALGRAADCQEMAEKALFTLRQMQQPVHRQIAEAERALKECQFQAE